jgi:hypothetical protein
MGVRKQTHEYELCTASLDEINKLAADGWRVAHVIPHTSERPTQILLERQYIGEREQAADFDDD